SGIPFVFASNVDTPIVVRLGAAIGSEQLHGGVKGRIVELGGSKADLHVVRVGKEQVEVVLAVPGVGANLASAQAHGLYGMAFQHPVAHVDHVDVLLHNDVAGKLAIPHPVAQTLLLG